MEEEEELYVWLMLRVLFVGRNMLLQHFLASDGFKTQQAQRRCYCNPALCDL